jgi:glycosyltransferase involved in cell wall biosynthesis
MVSVVLPVLNEARDIRRLLMSLLNQVSPPGGFEVLVADGGSTDGTRQIVTDLSLVHRQLRLLENPRRLSSAGRNVGLGASRGKYVVFIDGHCSLPRPDYLVRTVEIFESTAADCLCRPQPLLGLATTPWALAISRARHSWLGHNTGSDIYGGSPAYTDPRSAGAAYRRTSLEKVGFYDERFDACEDVEFNHRVAMADLTAYRHPDLRVDYRPRSTLRGLFEQMTRYGRGRARLMVRHPGRIPWALVVVSLGLVSPLFALALAGARSAGIVLGTGLALWSGVNCCESLRCGGLRGSPRVALAFSAIHLGLILGFWRGLLEFRRFREPLTQPTIGHEARQEATARQA